MNKIVVISPENSSHFANIDVKLLNERYVVEHVKIRGNTKVSLVASYIVDMIPAILRNDACFIWFADAHALAAVLTSKIFGKKSFIVVGGYEVSNVPRAGYGNQRITYRRFITNAALKHATRVITQSDVYKRIIENITNRGDVSVIHPPIDMEPQTEIPEKSDFVVMVASTTVNRGEIKGVSLYNAVASHFDIPFVIIGDYTDEAKKLYSNLIFKGRLPHDEVLRIMSGARVCCQLSRAESFGAAVVEAMSVGCIPVVTDVGALPDVIGEYGIVVDSGHMEQVATVEAIKTALTMTPTIDMLEYVRKFSTEKRKKLLLEAINEHV